MRASLLFSMLLFGCMTSQPQPVAVVGRSSSRLTDFDVQEIRRVVAAYQKDSLRKIDAIASNKIRVETGSDTRLLRFTGIKRNGKWRVNESGGIEAERKIITI